MIFFSRAIEKSGFMAMFTSKVFMPSRVARSNRNNSQGVVNCTFIISYQFGSCFPYPDYPGGIVHIWPGIVFDICDCFPTSQRMDIGRPFTRGQFLLTDAPGEGNFYRFQMNRMIDNTRLHAHVLDVITSTCTDQGELFQVIDYGRTIFSDENIDGRPMELLVEVSFEYLEGDTTWIFIQSLDEKAAKFYQNLDDQLLSIVNPFVEPVFLKSQVTGTIGVFGSAVLSDSVLFVYPQDFP